MDDMNYYHRSMSNQQVEEARPFPKMKTTHKSNTIQMEEYWEEERDVAVTPNLLT